MDKHTPGPWRITTDFIGVYDSEARRIANLDSDGAPDFGEDETLANARLISAAPDLLAGAAEAVAAWDMEEDTPEHNHEDRLEAAIAMLRAAIRKARGD